MVGSLADLGTAAEVGSPAAGEGPAGMVPAAGCIGHYLWGATARHVNESLSKNDRRETMVFFLLLFIRN